MFLSMIHISSVWTYVSYKKKFRNVENDIDDVATDLKGSVRKLKQVDSDLQQLTKALEKRLKEIEDLALIQKEKAKAAEEEDD